MQSLGRSDTSWALNVNSDAAVFSPKPVTDSRQLGVACGSASRWSCVPSACVFNCMSVSGLLACRNPQLSSIGRLIFNDAHLLLIRRVRVRLCTWAGVHALAPRCILLGRRRSCRWALRVVALLRFKMKWPVECCRRAKATVRPVYPWLCDRRVSVGLVS